MGQLFTLDDLPGIYREEYLYAVEVARAQHDPCLEWDAFTEAVWSHLARAFGLDAVCSSDNGPPRGRVESDGS